MKNKLTMALTLGWEFVEELGPSPLALSVPELVSSLISTMASKIIDTRFRLQNKNSQLVAWETGTAGFFH